MKSRKDEEKLKKYSKDFVLQLYEMMLRIRLCEESLVEPILSGDVQCPVHLYSGQEAVATGVCSALNGSDYIFGNHRSHGHFLAKGGSMIELIAEIYCKETGCSRGRGGSMHLIDPEIGMLGSAPIVSGTISLALGAALAASIRNDKRVAVCFFGDGATGEGVLYESLNFAALKKLPIIFVCENNLYATHMPVQDCRVNNSIHKIAEPFSIENSVINGNDVLQVYEQAQEAVRRCRAGEGPFFLECLTYRFRGHVGPDDNVQGSHTDIRPKNEIDRWLKNDPIKLFETYLLDCQTGTNQELIDIKNKVEEEVAEAYEIVKNSPYPDKRELLKYVYA
jgi:acetoin:2,6-dichlorophenolindophenol oxidoreductase subunit alpha